MKRIPFSDRVGAALPDQDAADAIVLPRPPAAPAGSDVPPALVAAALRLQAALDMRSLHRSLAQADTWIRRGRKS